MFYVNFYSVEDFNNQKSPMLSCFMNRVPIEREAVMIDGNIYYVDIVINNRLDKKDEAYSLTWGYAVLLTRNRKEV